MGTVIIHSVAMIIIGRPDISTDMTILSKFPVSGLLGKFC